MNATAAIDLGLRAARYVGPMLGVGRHRSAVWCLVRTPTPIEVLSGRRRLRGDAFAIPPGAEHELGGDAGRAVFWYLEPGLLSWPLPREAPSRLDAGQRRWLDSPSATTLLEDLPARLDPRLARALERLHADPSRSLSELSAGAGLSASRLRHLAVASLGVRLARYRWWLRLRLAARAALDGLDVTAAAHTAGFSDTAHLSRVFRRSFGFPPSTLFRALKR